MKLNSQLGSGNVLNTNNCEISICETRLKDKLIIFSAIDNLVKGASGQAIQNMNLYLSFPEAFRFKMRIIFLLIFIFLSNCNNPKTVLICGDHVCIK